MPKKNRQRKDLGQEEGNTGNPVCQGAGKRTRTSEEAQKGAGKGGPIMPRRGTSGKKVGKTGRGYDGNGIPKKSRFGGKTVQPGLVWETEWSEEVAEMGTKRKGRASIRQPESERGERKNFFGPKPRKKQLWKREGGKSARTTERGRSKFFCSSQRKRPRGKQRRRGGERRWAPIKGSVCKGKRDEDKNRKSRGEGD